MPNAKVVCRRSGVCDLSTRIAGLRHRNAAEIEDEMAAPSQLAMRFRNWVRHWGVQPPHEQVAKRPTERRRAPTRWPGWVWALPIAAVLIVGYLGLRDFLLHGPSVAVTFPVGGNLNAGNTKVEYQGLQVGQVNSVTLQKDLRHVTVSLSLHADLKGHLGPGTRFWIAGAQPSISDLASIKSLITGPYIGIDPHDGPAQDHYQGLASRPAQTETVRDPLYVGGPQTGRDLSWFAHLLP